MKKSGTRNLCIFILSLMMICSLFVHRSSALTLSAQALTSSAQALTLSAQALTSSAQALTLSAQEQTSPAQAQTRSKPAQTEGKKRAYSELKGLWISDEIVDPSYYPYRRELIQFADDRRRSFGISSLFGNVKGGYENVEVLLKEFEQKSLDSFELLYQVRFRDQGKKAYEKEYRCLIQWIDDNTIEIRNYPFSVVTAVRGEQENKGKPKMHRYRRIAKARLTAESTVLRPMTVDAGRIPPNRPLVTNYVHDEAERAKYLNYLEEKDQKILDVIAKDYAEIYKKKGKYEDIRLEVLIALEPITGLK